MRDVLLTQGTVWFLGQAGKRFGGVGACALGLDGRRCRWYRSLSARLGNMQHDEEPHEGQQSELVVKKVRNHDIAPSPGMVRRGIVAGFRDNGIIRSGRVHDPTSCHTKLSLQTGVGPYMR